MSQEYRTQVEQVSSVAIPALALLEDNFESTLVKWSAEQSGGFFGGQVTNFAYNGNNSYRMQTRSVGAVNDDFQGIVRFLGLTPKPKLNISFRLHNLGVNSRGGTIVVNKTVRLLNRTIIYTVELIPLTNVLQIRNSAGVLVPVSGAALPNFDDLWTRLEIQIDLRTGMYEFVAVGSRVYDLTSVRAHTTVTATSHSDLALRIRSIQAEGAAGIGTSLYVDDIVVTNPD